MNRSEGQTAQSLFEFAFRAQIKIFGLWVRSDRGNQHKLLCAKLERLVRDHEWKVIIDAPKGCLRSRFADCSSEGAENIVHLRQLQRSQALERHHFLGQLRITNLQLAPGNRNHAVVSRVSKQSLQAE